VNVVKKQKGASLLEVMIGLFVLAVGMLGFMGLLTSSLTMNQRSFTLSQAMFLAEDIAERARANRDVLANYAINYSENTTATASINPKCDSTLCTEAEMAAWDVAQWMEEVQQALPNSDGEVSVSTTGGITEMTIKIQYTLKEGKSGTGDVADLGVLEEFKVVTEI